MKYKFEEIQKDAELLELKEVNLEVQTITTIDMDGGVVSLHPSCTHPASVRCGAGSHRGTGHGWCYYCKKCNPR